MELDNLKTEAAKLRLTPQEKTAMKARIFGAPSPVQLVPSKVEGSPYFIFSYQFVQARVLAPAMVLLVVFMGAGTTAAAQGALPGDLLYPVKISINEAVEVALATTPVARAEVSAKLAERRVEEAETLAAKGTLSIQTGQALAQSFETHADNAEESAQEVEARDPATARVLRTTLGSSLSAHSAILAALTVGNAKENIEGTDAVAAKVLARADYGAPAPVRTAKMAAPAADAGNMTTMSLSIAADTATDTASTTVSLEGDMLEVVPDDSDSAEMEASAKKLEARANEVAAKARELFDANKKKLSGAIVTQVSGEFAAIDTLIERGSDALAEGDYDSVWPRFSEATERSIQLHTLLKAQIKIDRDIITPVFKARMIEVGPGEATILPPTLQ